MLKESERKDIIDFLKLHMSLNVNDFYIWYDEDGDEDSGHYEYLAYNDCEADAYEYGCSKLVLFYKELPHWVIKIPFLGEYFMETNEYCDFQYANKNGIFGFVDDNDYCAIESYVAEAACEYELGDMFAQTYYLTSIDGVKIYISEKVENDYYSGSCKDFKHEDSATQAGWLRESYCKTDVEKYVLTASDLAFFIDSYGLWQTELLIAFLTDYHIEDLHHGNIGFDVHGNIKIIDYSSFNN